MTSNAGVLIMHNWYKRWDRFAAHTLSNKVMTSFFKTLRDKEKDVEWWNYFNFLEEVLEFNKYLYSWHS